MRNLSAFVLFLVLLVLSTIGCGGSSTVTTVPVNDSRDVTYMPPEYCGDALIVPLMAGQHTDMGDVTVVNNGEFLYVHFTADDPWVIVDTHVAVADTLEGIPHNKNWNPKIGNFEFDGDTAIDISMWPAGTTLYIAAHAVVEMRGEGGEVMREETAWGEGEQFNEKGSWAMYFTYELQACCVELGLPEDLIDYRVNFGTNTYIATTMWNVGDGFWINDGDWDGWCCDKYHTIRVNTDYQCYVYNSYDPASWPDDPRLDVPWDKIAWILNNSDGYSKEDVQAAIWWFTDHYPFSGLVGILVNTANREGEGFVPGPGEKMPIIMLSTDPEVQMTIVEVPTDC